MNRTVYDDDGGMIFLTNAVHATTLKFAFPVVAYSLLGGGPITNGVRNGMQRTQRISDFSERDTLCYMTISDRSPPDLRRIT